MREKLGPRFHNKTVIPEISEGQTLVKFHGEPALIPAMTEGESMYGGTGFTERQVKVLINLECQRVASERLKNEVLL